MNDFEKKPPEENRQVTEKLQKVVEHLQNMALNSDLNGINYISICHNIELMKSLILENMSKNEFDNIINKIKLNLKSNMPKKHRQYWQSILTILEE